jgi:enoyl-CoA hydratase
VFRETRRRLDFRQAMDRCWQPIIAAIGGHCFGGGLELALACDIRLAAADSRLGLTEVDLAIIPGGGGTQRLPRLVGRGKGLELILTAARIDAAEALRICLVERVVPAGEARRRRRSWRPREAKAPGAALREGSRHQGLELPLGDGVRLENDWPRCCAPPRSTRRRQAFREAQARWQGR